MKRVLSLFGMFVVIAAFPLACHAQCSTSLMSGYWGGYTFGTDPGGYLANSITVAYFDGSGNYKSSWWGFQSGTYQSGTSNGTYSISTDSYTGSCYGTLVPSSGTGGIFVMAPANDTAYYLNETSGANLSSVWTKQDLSACSNSILSGTYGGYAFGTNPGNHLNNAINAWYFDGSGNYDLSTWGMQSGSYVSGTATGTYSTTTDSNTGACLAEITPSGSSTFSYAAIAGSGGIFYPLNQLTATTGANNSIVVFEQAPSLLTSCGIGTHYGGYAWGNNPGNHLDNSVLLVNSSSSRQSWFGMQSGSYSSGTASWSASWGIDSYTGACVGARTSGYTNLVPIESADQYFQMDTTSGANNTYVVGNQDHLGTCSGLLLPSVYFSGYQWGRQPGSHPGNSVAVYYFDGSGNYKLSYWEMLSGSSTSGTSSGTYAVGTDSYTGGCSVYLNSGSTPWPITGYGLSGQLALSFTDTTSGANSTGFASEQ